MQRRAELNVHKASALAHVWLVEAAILPSGYSEPNLQRKILWAILIGLGIGVCIAFFLEYLDTTVKSPEELQKITDLAYLGTIYHAFPEKTKRGVGELKMLDAPYSHIAEAFRTIKTNLLFSNVNDAKKVFLITSSGPREGKTFITANLGTALAQSGKKVLILETDLRNPAMHRIWGGERSLGLTNILNNGDSLEENLPIRATMVQNLDFLSSGEIPTNPFELLSSEKMDRFLSYAREMYDFVLLDSPPAFLTSDSLVLAQKTDGVIFITRSGEVQREVLKETLNRFLRLKVKMLGIIFNDVNREGGRYYYYKYSYYYKNDGTKVKKKKKSASSGSRDVYPSSGIKT
jgi:polysaccharide biosynthesis transport protein